MRMNRTNSLGSNRMFNTRNYNFWNYLASYSASTSVNKPILEPISCWYFYCIFSPKERNNQSMATEKSRLNRYAEKLKIRSISQQHVFFIFHEIIIEKKWSWYSVNVPARWCHTNKIFSDFSILKYRLNSADQVFFIQMLKY